MLNFMKKKRDTREPEAPTIGDTHRVYAIGDIHGRADLFRELLGRISDDDARRPELPSRLILLGDLVDRGHQSAEVVAHALELAEAKAPVRFLMGNHEEVFVRAARGDEKATRFFCRIGGKETILSYGLSEDAYAAMDFPELAEWMLNNVPRQHVDFLESFEDLIEIGDYLFVHAGIRPDVPIEQQKPSDLRWIRDDFLSFREPHSKIVVHGHTITEKVDEQVNRIGIDTGAYQSGRLTAIGLEGERRWYVATGD